MSWTRRSRRPLASRALASRAPASRAPASRAPASRAPASRAPASRAPASRAPASGAAARWLMIWSAAVRRGRRQMPRRRSASACACCWTTAGGPGIPPSARCAPNCTVCCGAWPTPRSGSWLARAETDPTLHECPPLTDCPPTLRLPLLSDRPYSPTVPTLRPSLLSDRPYSPTVPPLSDWRRDISECRTGRAAGRGPDPCPRGRPPVAGELLLLLLRPGAPDRRLLVDREARGQRPYRLDQRDMGPGAADAGRLRVRHVHRLRRQPAGGRPGLRAGAPVRAVADPVRRPPE